MEKQVRFISFLPGRALHVGSARTSFSGKQERWLVNT